MSNAPLSNIKPKVDISKLNWWKLNEKSHVKLKSNANLLFLLVLFVFSGEDLKDFHQSSHRLTMPRKNKPKPNSRPKLTYSHQSMIGATNAVLERKMGLTAAVKAFGVKRSALQKRVQGLFSVKTHGTSRPAVLSKAEEDEMARCLRVLSSWGLGFIKEELLDLVADYVKVMKIRNPFTEGRPGRDWYYGFLKRHPDLALRTPEQLN